MTYARIKDQHQSTSAPESTGRVLLFSVSHHRAPVELREKLAFDHERRSALLQDLRQFATQTVSIATCNRTEVYLVLEPGTDQGRDAITQTIARHANADRSELETASRVETDENAVRHLFRVACGLDSAILGEPQILGQVRDAMMEAHDEGTSGPVLERLFQRALATGKRARARTGISRGAGSISHAAVRLARETVGDLSDKRAVTVGLGEMGCLVARNLYAHGVGRIDVCNRTLERARQIAGDIGGRAVPWDELPEAVYNADIVITATGADSYVITTDHLSSSNGQRHGTRLIIDISVPRNVDPRVGELPNVQLYSIDQLQSVRTQGMQEREREIPRVEAIIQDEVAEYMHWLRSRQLAPIIQDLYAQASSIQQHELDKALRRLGHLPERDQEVVRALAHGIVQKLLHTPVTQLKETDEPEEHADVIGTLFQIDRDY